MADDYKNIQKKKSMQTDTITWTKTAKVESFPENGGMAVLIDGKQIAVFNFKKRNEWYATDNMCPHKNEMCIARGMVGDSGGEPKVACPFHKRNFSLESGKSLSGDDYKLGTYPVKVEDGYVYISI